MIRRLHRGSVALGIVLAVLFGQFATHLHDLGHALEKVAAEHREGTPAKTACETHSLCAQLGSAANPTPPVFAIAAADRIAVSTRVPDEAPQPQRLAYRAQAPPA